MEIIIVIEKEKEVVIMKKEILNIIDKLIDNAIKENGLEDKKTIQIVENAEKIKEKYEQNLIKIF